MVDFPDAHGSEPAMKRYGEFFPQTSNWYRTSSYGRLNYHPEAPVKRWLRMPSPFSSYGIQRGSPTSRATGGSPRTSRRPPTGRWISASTT